ncbi:MAG: hypothetical protein AAGB15_12175, partial [Pseudomonadota bacterium]
HPDALQSVPSVPGAALALLGALLSVLAAKAALAGRLIGQIGASIMAAVALYAGILQFSLPGLGTGFASPAIAEVHTQYRACASGPGYSIGYHEPSFVFLTDTEIRMADPESALTALAEQPGTMVFLTDRWAEILGTSVPDAVERASLRYFNYNRGKMETIRLLTADEPRWRACER